MLHAHHARNIERYFQAIFVISFGKRTTIVKFHKISSTIVLRSFTIVKFRSTKFYEILRNFTKFYDRNDRKISYYDRRQPVKNNFLGIFFFIPLGNKVYEGFGTFSGILFNDNFTQFFYRKFKTRSLNFISRVFHFFSLQFLQSGILFLFFSR